MYLNLGSGPLPLHPQHLKIMENYAPLDKWTLIDKYIDGENIKNWDITTLEEIKNNSCNVCYSSHSLEHFSHTEVPNILKLWFNKLKDGGKIILNVPNLLWVSRQIVKFSNEGITDSKYFWEFSGEHGLEQIIYGSHSHEGEYHKSGFIKSSLEKLLKETGFKNINITEIYEAHDMGCLLAVGEK